MGKLLVNDSGYVVYIVMKTMAVFEKFLSMRDQAQPISSRVSKSACVDKSFEKLNDRTSIHLGGRHAFEEGRTRSKTL